MSARLTSRQVASRVAAREGFRAGGLAGTPGRVGTTGALPQGLAESYGRIADQVVYTITSKGTPIAWLTGRGTWSVPVLDGIAPSHRSVVETVTGVA